MREIIMLINLNSNKLNYGAVIGFKLSRLEWLWDSELIEAADNLKFSMEDLISKLPSELQNIQMQRSYEKIVCSIFDFFFKNDIETYYAIRIGMGIQRCTLYATSKNTALLELALSALDTIPDSIVLDKKKLIEFIIQNKDEDIFHLINKIESFERPVIIPEAQSLHDRIKDFIKKLQSYIDMNSDNILRVASVAQARTSIKKFKSLEKSIDLINVDLEIIEKDFQQECRNISQALGWNNL